MRPATFGAMVEVSAATRPAPASALQRHAPLLKRFNTRLASPLDQHLCFFSLSLSSFSLCLDNHELGWTYLLRSRETRERSHSETRTRDRNVSSRSPLFFFLLHHRLLRLDAGSRDLSRRPLALWRPNVRTSEASIPREDNFRANVTQPGGRVCHS